MPTAVFPRPAGLTLLTTTGISVPTGRRTQTWSGAIQTRSSMNVGRSWSETYQPLKAGNADAENFISWLRWAWNTGTVFTIKHLMTPGSGVAPNGTGTGGVTVSGGSQTGSSIVTTGWPSSTSNVARAGDLISIAGVGYTLEVTDDANSSGVVATLKVNPPVWTAPSGGAAVTTTSTNINAIILDLNIPDITRAFWYDGITVQFREVPS